MLYVRKGSDKHQCSAGRRFRMLIAAGQETEVDAGYAKGGSLCNKGVSIVLLQAGCSYLNPSVYPQLALRM